MNRAWAPGGVAVVVALACVQVGVERADADELVGKASTASLEVDVANGLACVRSVSPGALVLRAQAPTFQADVRVRDGSRELDLTVQNALFDATLEARDPGGAPLEVTVVAAADGAPRTQRRWRVALAADGQVRLALHAPDEASRAPWRFGVMADVQEAIDSVSEVYAVVNRDPSTRFLLFSGDLTRQGTREELERFEREERALTIPLYATMGNHELGADRVHFQEMFGRGNFHFDFRGVAFTMLDSASATLPRKVHGWLDGWLAAARDDVHVVAMHIPPLDPAGTRNGAFGNRGEASALLAKLADARVDVTFYGHIHSFYAYANAGIPAYISGGGGAIPERLDGIGRNFLTVDVDPIAGRIDRVSLVRVDPD